LIVDHGLVMGTQRLTSVDNCLDGAITMAIPIPELHG